MFTEYDIYATPCMLFCLGHACCGAQCNCLFSKAQGTTGSCLFYCSLDDNRGTTWRPQYYYTRKRSLIWWYKEWRRTVNCLTSKGIQSLIDIVWLWLAKFKTTRKVHEGFGIVKGLGEQPKLLSYAPSGVPWFLIANVSVYMCISLEFARKFLATCRALKSLDRSMNIICMLFQRMPIIEFLTASD